MENIYFKYIYKWISLLCSRNKHNIVNQLCVCQSLIRVWLFAIPWTVACKAPLFMRFSRQEYWSGKVFPSSGDLPDPGIEPGSSAMQADAFTISAPLVQFSSVTQSCLTLCDPMDCSLQGSSVLEIVQAGILEWVSVSSSRVSPWSRAWTCVFCIGKQIRYHWVTWEAILRMNVDKC